MEVALGKDADDDGRLRKEKSTKETLPGSFLVRAEYVNYEPVDDELKELLGSASVEDAEKPSLMKELRSALGIYHSLSYLLVLEVFAVGLACLIRYGFEAAGIFKPRSWYPLIFVMVAFSYSLHSLCVYLEIPTLNILLSDFFCVLPLVVVLPFIDPFTCSDLERETLVTLLLMTIGCVLGSMSVFGSGSAPIFSVVNLAFITGTVAGSVFAVCDFYVYLNFTSGDSFLISGVFYPVFASVLGRVFVSDFCAFALPCILNKKCDIAARRFWINLSKQCFHVVGLLVLFQINSTATFLLASLSSSVIESLAAWAMFIAIRSSPMKRFRKSTYDTIRGGLTASVAPAETIEVRAPKLTLRYLLTRWLQTYIRNEKYFLMLKVQSEATISRINVISSWAITAGFAIVHGKYEVVPVKVVHVAALLVIEFIEDIVKRRCLLRELNYTLCNLPHYVPDTRQSLVIISTLYCIMFQWTAIELVYFGCNEL
mmetsp:Transcript_16445/g.26746  ORF Transcript_16445/g.26746 Transcript_16445/m.26746 type:complete len:484 (+) Transcript_16445:1980-3431(+)